MRLSPRLALAALAAALTASSADAGYLYRADNTGIGGVARYSTEGANIGPFIPFQSDGRSFTPNYLHLDGRGNIYLDGRYKYAPDGTFLDELDEVGGGTGPESPVVVAADGSVYAAVRNSASPGALITRYSPSGMYEADVFLPDLGPPNGLALDAAGNLYVAHQNGVRRLTADLDDMGAFTPTPITVEQMVFDAAGDLYVSSTDEIIRFSAAGDYLGVFAPLARLVQSLRPYRG